MESRYSFFFSNLYTTKVLQNGLCLIWVCGLFLIGVSFYVIQWLPITFTRSDGPDLDFDGPKITLFTAPRPFSGSTGERQGVAVRSWLALSENVNVVLFSQDPSASAFADSFGRRVTVEPEIDFTFMGTPFFHSMVARAMASESHVSVMIDPTTIVLSNLLSTLLHAYKLDEDWLLVASSRNVSSFPFRLGSDGRSWLGDDDGKSIRVQKLQEFIARKGFQKPYGDRMIIAWKTGDLPLHRGVLPPFLYGKGLHDRWIVSEALISDFRLVIDASSTVSTFYIDEDSDVEDRSWELDGNSLLGRLYGSFSFRSTNCSNLFRFYACGRNFLLVNTDLNTAYPVGSKRCIDAIKSVEKREGCLQEEKTRNPIGVSIPVSLESVLAMVADENKNIVVGVAGFSYKDMLMSWVCRLRRLRVSNFFVCALDDQIYDFSALQGLAVIKCANPPANISFDDCHFGTECFQKVTKRKSRIVLRVLKMGYNVLLSDVDVYWFKNPLPYLRSFGPAVLVAQSDEYRATGPINLPRRLNSGFYYARADDVTVAAMEKVVKHAAESRLSEQPSFYDTLCGEGGEYRVGDDECVEPETRLMVRFLDRDRFPNGAYRGLWEVNDTAKACLERGCFVLHNNWINARKKKLERQLRSGLWEYDVDTRMCLQSWHRTKPTNYF